MTQTRDALVLFGVTGDLAQRKLFPALYELAVDERLPDRIVGVARSDWDDASLVEQAREALETFHEVDVDESTFDSLAGRLSYLRGDYLEAETYERLKDALGDCERPLVYLAVPPSLFESVVANLAASGLARESGVVIEKPFGRDLASSHALNSCLLEHFSEESIFRIDHFLGKEEVLDLLVFRLGNTFLEPAWNRHYIDSVEITMAESFGVEGRGGFYDEVGALRDVVQNHLLQLVSLVAMEPPVSAEAEALRDEKVKVLKAIPPLKVSQVVRGQYVGYTDEEGVAEGSDVETYVALRLEIDSWRWAGVPFYIRAGKKMPVTATEILIEFKPPPRLFFTHSEAPVPHPNHLIFRTKPGETVSISAQIKEPGDALVSRPVELTYRYDTDKEGARDDAYARLLSDALDGDQRLFARADGVEEAWRLLEDVLAEPGSIHMYEPGSWGPLAADELASAHGGWHEPQFNGGE